MSTEVFVAFFSSNQWPSMEYKGLKVDAKGFERMV